jgi:hypothetical protein
MLPLCPVGPIGVDYKIDLLQDRKYKDKHSLVVKLSALGKMHA